MFLYSLLLNSSVSGSLFGFRMDLQVLFSVSLQRLAACTVSKDTVACFDSNFSRVGAPDHSDSFDV